MGAMTLMGINTQASDTQRATFGGGCFWCLEAVFERVEGVKSVTSGYAGGATPDPTYKEVCSEDTGHAEVIEIEFDPANKDKPELTAAKAEADKRADVAIEYYTKFLDATKDNAAFTDQRAKVEKGLADATKFRSPPPAASAPPTPPAVPPAPETKAP